MSRACNLLGFVIAVRILASAACASDADLIAACKGGMAEDAIKACTTLLATAQQGVHRLDYFKARGHAYAGLNRQDLAIADFTEAIRLDPNDQVLYTSRCWSKAVLGKDFDDALKDCDTAQHLTRDKWGTLNAIGYIRLRQGRYAEAVAAYDAALVARPENVESLYARGVAKLRLGDLSGGQTDIAVALAKDANVEPYFASIGVAADVSGPGMVSNPEMRAMFDADQSARKAQPIDWKTLVPADEKRWTRTRELLDQGALHTADDFEEAAFIFQHGADANSFLLAHVLATIAVEKGNSSAIWIAAATLDRYLQKIGQKQVLGTQFLKGSADAIWTMDPYDRDLIPDTLRAEFHVPALADQAKELESMQKQKGR